MYINGTTDRSRYVYLRNTVFATSRDYLTSTLTWATFRKITFVFRTVALMLTTSSILRVFTSFITIKIKITRLTT